MGTPRLAFAPAVWALVASAACAVACSGSAAPQPPVVVNDGSTLTFTPTELLVNRYPTVCGVANPPYGAGDLFSMGAIGVGAGDPSAGPLTAIDLSFHTPLAPQFTSALVLSAATPEQAAGGPYRSQSATTGDSSLTFSFQWGTNAAEIDPNTLRLVDVTILAIPGRDGDPLTVRFVLQFADGKTLDETFSAPASTVSSSCGAG
jgi:hypothetical protein